jgi:hypothetical protein
LIRTAESTAIRPLAISLIADVMAGVRGGVAGGVYAHAERRQQAFQWAVRNSATEAPLICAMDAQTPNRCRD